MGDTVTVIGKRLTLGDRRRLVKFSRGTGIVIEIRGGGYFADYTNPRRYIIQLPSGRRICPASELKLVKRKTK